MADKDKKNAPPCKISKWSISTDGGILGIFLVVGAIVAGGLICFYGSKEFEFTRADFLALGVVAGACVLTLVVRWSANIRKIPRWFVSTETGRFLIFLFVEAIVAGVFFCFHSCEGKDLEFTRTLILAIATVGGLYGLILAAFRSAKLSEQVKTAKEQLFSQLLGQGAKLLANGEIVMLPTGIRLLADLAEGLINEPKQVKLIMSVIHDSVCSKATPPLKDKETEDKEVKDKEVKDKDDIEISIKTLGSLYNASGKLDEFKELVQFQGCYLVGLNLKDVKLQEADFSAAKLQNTNFRSAELQWVNFTDAELRDADFRHAKLQGAKFNLTELQEAKFNLTELQGVNFTDAKLQDANFNSAELQGVDFRGAGLQGVNFKNAKLEWADCSMVDFLDAQRLTRNHVNGMIFLTDHPPILPKRLEQFLNEDRCYESKKDPNDESSFSRCFIESDAEWSGKDVDEWVREYLASIRGPEDA